MNQIMRWVFILFLACSPACADDGVGRPPCSPPTVFPGAPGALRVEQASRASTAEEAHVPLQPTDAGHRLRVYPTTESDIWQAGGSVRFVDSGGLPIYEVTDLCVSDFATMEFDIPASAVEVVLVLPTEVIATVLFTLVVE